MRNATWYSSFAKTAARVCGKPPVFVLAVAVIAVWLVTGPLFGFSDTWQLVINTGTTIITFLMVFLIQNTQNRDSEAMHVKMDEVIRALHGAHTSLIGLEDLDDDMLETVRKRYRELAVKARAKVEAGGKDSGCEEVHIDLSGVDGDAEVDVQGPPGSKAEVTRHGDSAHVHARVPKKTA
jgi:low affinity Fe/Cu permease